MTGKERSKTVVLFNEVGSGSTQDELDVLAQVESVSRELKALGFNPRQIPVARSQDGNRAVTDRESGFYIQPG